MQISKNNSCFNVGNKSYIGHANNLITTNQPKPLVLKEHGHSVRSNRNVRAKLVREKCTFDVQGQATAKEFYKRHHRWTEGLISAAKAVGWGAKVLV